MKINIDWLTDASDCETCGSSYATGAFIRFEDGTELDMSPSAHCFGGSSHTEEDVFRAILKHLGHDVSERDTSLGGDDIRNDVEDGEGS